MVAINKYIYKKSDAFTSGDSLGNPAACLYTGREELSGDDMLSIAKQHKGFVSEVVYCSQSAHAACKLTYYSSECEVDFCGHGTVAAMYELLKQDETLRKQKEILFETNKKGTLVLYNELETEDAVYICAPEARKYDVPASEDEIAKALGIESSELDSRYPLALIDAGLKTLIVPFASYQREVSLFPDEARLKAFCEDQGIDIVLIFTMDTSAPG